MSRNQRGRAEATLPRLLLQDITKTYPTVVANDGISLQVLPGEIHAVLGENGAGKSTLMKIIYGLTRPERGRVLWDGVPVCIDSPAQARRLGIGMVFQHFCLFETLTVSENIALAVHPPLDRAGLGDRIRLVSERYGVPLDPGRLVHSLSLGERQRVEIVRCLLQEPRLLIMDEPTSALAPPTVLKLFETLRRLATEGCSVLYVSHKLEEIRELCHTVTVLRGGRVSGQADPRRETASSLARMMIGRDLPLPRHAPPAPDGEPRLRIAGLSRSAEEPFGINLEHVWLTVYGGEIVGIAGIAGNGQQELLAALSGEAPLSRRQGAAIQIDGQPVAHLDAAARRSLGLSFVPAERLGRGAVPAMSLAQNALLTGHGRGMVRYGLVAAARVARFAQRCIDDYDVRCGGIEAMAGSLSGGNLQKFILGREILQEPRILLAAQPTWGLDVAAAAAIRQALIDLRSRGVAVLVISEELEELCAISDRITVMAAGRLSPARPTGEISQEELGLWMGGLFPAAESLPAAARAPDED